MEAGHWGNLAITAGVRQLLKKAVLRKKKIKLKKKKILQKSGFEQ